MQKIINRLLEIDEWIRKNGFGNRGLHSASQDAENLEKALQRLLCAYDTLDRWERTYKKFFIEKALDEYPNLIKKYPNQVFRFKGNWMNPYELDDLYRTIEHYIEHLKRP